MGKSFNKTKIQAQHYFEFIYFATEIIKHISKLLQL